MLEIFGSGIVIRDISRGQHSGDQTYMTGDVRTCVIIGAVCTDPALTDTTELMTMLS
jgi:hypothetical protein